MKKIINVMLVAVISCALFLASNNTNNFANSLDLSSLLAITTVNAESVGTYSGPLCSNQSGSVYCCKDSDSSSSCAAGAKCSSCQ